MLQTEKKGERIYDINLPRGDFGELVLTLINYVPEEGDKIVFKMGKDLNTPIIKKTVPKFIENQISVALLAEDTKNLFPGKYFYVVRLIKPDGTVDTLIEKSVLILEDA